MIRIFKKYDGPAANIGLITWTVLIGVLAVTRLVDSLPVLAQAGNTNTTMNTDAGAAPSSSEHLSAGMVDMNPAALSLMNLASGTSENPMSWPMPMLTMHFGNWNSTFMANGFLIDTQQSGPRGGDKFFSTNWFMGSAEHSLGTNGALQAEIMLSLEPATITNRSYPLLFQTGETAYGVPLVDSQHPHNFIMSLGFHFTRAFGENTTLDLYFAPVGDPALGPVAYPHRASAMELPDAPISHHLQDSTHISDEVLTLGLSFKKVKLEASGFYGSEPGENRWTIETGPINSWSTRLWFFPAKNWAAQVSWGRLARPEALELGDQIRTTASLQYSKPIFGGSWSSSLIWGRTHNTENFHDLNSYLVESALPVGMNNFITGRIELADKDELFVNQLQIQQHLDFVYGSVFRIGAYTIGYTRDFKVFPSIETGIGGNFSFYSLPDAIKPYYGSHPMGGNIFIRFRLRPQE